MKRREFLNWVGVGGVASFLPMAIAACSPSGESTTEVSTTPSNFEPVGTVSELETQGQILNENFGNGAISVTRNPEDSQLLYAVNPTCTHKGCLVDWNAGERKYLCPCHGSEYSPDGTVIKGPAQENLPPYLVKIEGDQVLVQGI